ncbi:N-acetylglucosaminyl deacetylase, LmbE family [Polaromonas sp. OV174]|uniref:PIG-L deacetylase family protein n=1 Tax=Polaromonas sp. OV174 TaxID=1855300 RepID=UPI0008F0832A|nr:PIG-L deacetylase family protein [Polaromonas sp. OV174]SFC17251.1 N-acetylglucosaminyl deacetylase, LmbE family [Polaromonas sp. OV174]
MSEDQHIPYQASSLPVPGAVGVLVLAPHPDDEVFGCGGCAALYALSGVPVQALILTDGGLHGVPPAGVAVVAARQEEARAAAKVLGCQPPIFGHYADRSLSTAGGALVNLIVRQMKECGADVLLAPSVWEIHPDHRAAALAAIEAIQQLGAGHTLVQYEVGAPLLPNVLLDITPVWQRKQQAMACFGSQLALQAYDRHISALNVFRTYTLPAAVQAAEGLRVATQQQAKEDPFGLVFQGNPHPVREQFLPPDGWLARLFRPHRQKLV